MLWIMMMSFLLGIAASSAIDVCTLPYNVGACDDVHVMYYYDVTLGRCLRFKYGGCGGNENRFPDLESCQHTCGGQAQLQKEFFGDVFTMPYDYSRSGSYSDNWIETNESGLPFIRDYTYMEGTVLRMGNAILIVQVAVVFSIVLSLLSLCMISLSCRKNKVILVNARDGTVHSANGKPYTKGNKKHQSGALYTKNITTIQPSDLCQKDSAKSKSCSAFISDSTIPKTMQGISYVKCEEDIPSYGAAYSERLTEPVYDSSFTFARMVEEIPEKMLDNNYGIV